LAALAISGQSDYIPAHRSSSRYALSLASAPDFLPFSFEFEPAGYVSGRASRPKEMVMAAGTVKFFNTTKGFGFIAPDGGGKDVFVHISAVERAGLRGLADGQKVSFDLEKDRQGRESATNLKTE
jgi:CspA family cold shock protein